MSGVYFRVNIPSMPPPGSAQAAQPESLLKVASEGASNLSARNLRSAAAVSRLQLPLQNEPSLSAGALVEAGDREMALRYAQTLVGRVVQLKSDRTQRNEGIQTVPYSSFGLAWSRLGKALTSEPFATYAAQHTIDISTLRIYPNAGTMIWGEDRDGATARSVHTVRGTAATADVLAAARGLSSDDGPGITYPGDNLAPTRMVAEFYGQDHDMAADEHLYQAGKLLSAAQFDALRPDASGTQEYDAVRQRQRAAKNQLAQLPLAQRQVLVNPENNLPPSTRVERADKIVAQLCARAILSRHLATPSPASTTISKLSLLPEYSTLEQMRRNLKDAIASGPFMKFVQDKGLSLPSLSIDTTTGELSGQVDGVTRVFTLKGPSGWPAILEYACKLAVGSTRHIGHPDYQACTLTQVLDFYGEKAPSNSSLDILKYATGLQDHGFYALNDSDTPSDAHSRVVQQKQAAAKNKLAEQEATQTAQPSQTETVAPDEAQGDKQLALAVSAAMLEVKTAPATLSSKKLTAIPPQSSFGKWSTHLGNAFKGKGITEWASLQQIDPASMSFDPVGKILHAKVKGEPRSFPAAEFAQKYPQHFDALEPVVKASEALVPNHKRILLTHTSNGMAPYELVSNFYGIDNSSLDSPQFVQTAEHLKSNGRFPQRPENPKQATQALADQQTALGDSNNRYALIAVLTQRLVNGGDDKNMRITVDPASSHNPKGSRTVGDFVADNGWNPLLSHADKINLLIALQTPIPQQSALGNKWGFLSTQVSLTTELRGQVIQQASAFTNGANLFGYLTSRISHLSTDPKTRLVQILDSAEGHRLGETLQSHFKGMLTPTSIKQWLLTALVLSLEPDPGMQRNTLAGFDFMGKQHWGVPAGEILQRFTENLKTTPNLPAADASAAAHLLLAGFAPQFLVSGMPQTLTYSSPAWAGFVIAVNRIEQIAPGATGEMTYPQVMDFNKTQPISKSETLQLVRAQMNPVIDWGIMNGILVNNGKDQYSFDNYQLALDKLKLQAKETAEAKQFLNTHPIPNRFAMAQKHLEETFGKDMPYLLPKGLWRESDNHLAGVYASVAEAYIGKKLGDDKPQPEFATGEIVPKGTPAWETRDPRINIKHLHDKANELPDVTAEFDTLIEADYPQRRKHSIVAISDLLSRQPQDVIDDFILGSREYYSLREPDKFPSHGLKGNKVVVGKKGKHGVLVRVKRDGVTKDYAIHPESGTVQRISGLPASMPLGGTNPNYKRVFNDTDEGGHTLPLDFQAFSSATAPRTGVSSTVIVERIVPQSIVDGELINDDEVIFSAGAGARGRYFDETLKLVATTVVDSHFLRKDEFKALNRGHTPLEDPVPTDLQGLNKLARLIPGVSSLEDIYQGNYIEAGKDLFVDALTIALPAGIGKVWGMIGDAIEKTTVNTGEHAITRATEGALTDMSASATARESVGLSRLQNANLAGEAIQLEQRAAIADGIVAQGGPIKPQAKVTAVLQNGNWYAYDIKTRSAYGPPLADFVSETSIPLSRETFSDGTTALVSEKPLSKNAYTIKRSRGFDLVDGDKVYRYDPAKPDHLSDLQAADHYKELEGFENFCPVPSPAGRIVKRGTSDECFVRIINPLEGELPQAQQAVEHRRLYPVPGNPSDPSRYTVFERRLYKTIETDTGTKLVATMEKQPITYKSSIRGQIINDENFGFYGNERSDVLNTETRVVKLGPISDLCNDARELRGIVVSSSTNGQPVKYLVVEADTGEFYKAKLSDPETANVMFNKLNRSDVDTSLAKAYRDCLYTFEDATGMEIDNSFVSLPKLEDAYIELEQGGYSKADVDRLKEICRTMPAEQQREVAYQLQHRGAIGTPDIALKPNNVEHVSLPENFSNLSAEQQNKFYAEQAKESVVKSLDATGLGRSNVLSDVQDIPRSKAANAVIGWLRNTRNPNTPFTGKMTIKTGAGNCGEMRTLATEIINKSGGKAYRWSANGDHAFAVVGGPVTPPGKTFDFSEPVWADAWVVDPWANIACPAREYTQQLQKVMAEWDKRGIAIRAGGYVQPTEWLKNTFNGANTPYYEDYKKP